MQNESVFVAPRENVGVPAADGDVSVEKSAMPAKTTPAAVVVCAPSK
jgi:hypothetical protein